MSKNKENITIHSSAAEYLTYVAAVGTSADSIEMRYENENIWLTQKLMAVLYDVDVRTINYHLKKIFEDGSIHPTNAYIFLTGQDSFLSKIQCGMFKGTTRAVFVDKRDYEGPLW